MGYLISSMGYPVSRIWNNFFTSCWLKDTFGAPRKDELRGWKFVHPFGFKNICIMNRKLNFKNLNLKNLGLEIFIGFICQAYIGIIGKTSDAKKYFLLQLWCVGMDLTRTVSMWVSKFGREWGKMMVTEMLLKLRSVQRSDDATSWWWR